MQDWAGKRYWLVGASEGLGLALAHQINATGAEVILSARRAGLLEAAVSSMPGRASAVPCDVTDRASVQAAANQIGPVDGLVYLAGVGGAMRAQDWDAARAEAMIDTNLTGCVRVLGAVLPGMVARDSGHIVITSSLAAYRGLGASIGYGASKAGCLALAESLHADLRLTGVKVQVALPGPIRTRMTADNTLAKTQPMEPDAAARHMFELMCTDHFRTAFPWPLSWLYRMGQFVPDWVWVRLSSRWS